MKIIIKNATNIGVYSKSTGLAYEQVVNDGADIINCLVQMTKDGMILYMSCADLVGYTTAVAMNLIVGV